VVGVADAVLAAVEELVNRPKGITHILRLGSPDVERETQEQLRKLAAN
jgi:hypothetical protein